MLISAVTASVCLELSSRSGMIKKLAVLFIATFVCCSDLDWDDEKHFPHGTEDEDDEEDGDDDAYEEDVEDEEDENNPLTYPLKKSSDTFIRFRKVFRRFRRRGRSGRGGFRFRRFIGRGRSGR